MTAIRLTALAVTVCLTLGSTWAQAERSAGQHIDDSTIATSAKAALAKVDLGSAGALNVEVHKGRLQLAGFVHTDEARNAALGAAGSVTGAVEVLDAIVVLPGKRTAGQTFDDTAIQTKLKAALTEQLGAGTAVRINTEVRKSNVILSGFVDDAATQSKAGEVARGISGVAAVHNRLAIAL